MIKEQLITLINNIISKEGYKRKGTKWYKNVEGVTAILYLQKSAYSDQFYINLYSRFEELYQRYKFDGHVSLRYGEKFMKDIDEYFNLANQIPDKARAEEIKIIIKHLLPLLKQFETIGGIKDALRTYDKRMILIGDAETLLEQS